MAKESVIGNLMPFLVMVLVQVGYAGMNITVKVALESGMNPLVLVAYRQMFATLAIIPFALWLEWDIRPKITKPLLLQILLSSVTGATMNQVFYFVGLTYTTPTVGCALTNILPAMTFIIAIIFRQESIGFKTRTQLAKVIGTAVCVGGAMLLSFYNGPRIHIGESSIHWRYADKMSSQDKGSKSQGGASSIIGAIFVLGSTLAWAVWFVIQERISKKYPAPYKSTAMMCLMSSVQCAIIGISVQPNLSAWSLTSSIRLFASAYSGVVCTGLGFCLMSWTIQRKGPLYVSIFSPLLLVIVAILSWTLLREKLYLGTVIGSFLIVVGLYSVLWGKDKESKEIDDINEAMHATKQNGANGKDNDLELQPHVCPNGNH